jgi:hypothetical protein
MKNGCALRGDVGVIRQFFTPSLRFLISRTPRLTQSEDILTAIEKLL